MALRYRVCLGMLEEIIENRIETIHIVGGGTQNELLCQMTADACNRAVVAGPGRSNSHWQHRDANGRHGYQSAIPHDQIGAINQARAIIRESFSAKTYMPQNSAAWDEPADRFQTALNKKRITR